MNPLKFLDGYKTYIGVAAWVVVSILTDMGVITGVYQSAIMSMVEGWTGVSLIHKTEKVVKRLGKG